MNPIGIVNRISSVHARCHRTESSDQREDCKTDRDGGAGTDQRVHRRGGDREQAHAHERDRAEEAREGMAATEVGNDLRKQRTESDHLGPQRHRRHEQREIGAPAAHPHGGVEASFTIFSHVAEAITILRAKAIRTDTGQSTKRRYRRRRPRG